MERDRPLILVVDDETHIVHVLSLKLRNAGYEVLTAEDGEAGLALAREHAPDMVITDFQMPVMSGLEMCVALKADPATSETPALMLTARGYRMIGSELEQTNIGAVLTKPFSPRDVLGRVADLVGPGKREESAA